MGCGFSLLVEGVGLGVFVWPILLLLDFVFSLFVVFEVWFTVWLDCVVDLWVGLFTLVVACILICCVLHDLGDFVVFVNSVVLLSFNVVCTWWCIRF